MRKTLCGVSLLERFQTTCGWCMRRIAAGTEVFGGKVRAPADVDISSIRGQVIEVYSMSGHRRFLMGVSGLGSEALEEGWDMAYMTCSPACGEKLREALRQDMELVRALAEPEDPL